MQITWSIHVGINGRGKSRRVMNLYTSSTVEVDPHLVTNQHFNFAPIKESKMIRILKNKYKMSRCFDDNLSVFWLVCCSYRYVHFTNIV